NPGRGGTRALGRLPPAAAGRRQRALRAVPDGILRRDRTVAGRASRPRGTVRRARCLGTIPAGRTRMSRYFSEAGLKFLRELARHNEKAWFDAHRADYEAHVREPFQRLLVDLQPALAEISPHFRADPAKSGGS